MENQHRQIAGYRELSQEEIDLMNEVKGHAEQTRALVKKINERLNIANGVELDPETSEHLGEAVYTVTEEAYEMGRWLQIGQDHLQQGFMALTRSIARPTTF